MSKKAEFNPEYIQLALFAKSLSHPVRVYIVHKLSHA